MRAAVPVLVAVEGAELRMLVLVAGVDGCVGVDLESGAFVRASYRRGGDSDADLAPFDVVVGEVATADEPPDVSRPETVTLAAPPRRTGYLTARKAERYLTPLHHPNRAPLLGFPGPTVPYWTLAGDRPSLTLVELVAGPQVRRVRWGWECRFPWHGARHAFPLTDARVTSLLDEVGWPRYSSRDLHRLLGYRTRRALVMLTPPRHGYCYKVVAALLPAG
ncbi:MAG TPA: hypothetical protein VHG90_10505 [Acidimicrobiales bacterium]|nr:hypothetical protein [Acidimicrobiales bacterium]